MAGRQTLATFESKAAEFVTFHQTATTSAPFAQVESWKFTAERAVKTTQRVSDATEYDTITALRANGTIVLFHKNDPVELAKFLGTSKPTAGGWVGTETIALAATFAEQATYYMVAWDGTATASASKQSVTTLTNLRVLSWDFDATAGNDVKYTVNVKADSVSMAPAVGVGTS